MCGVVWCQMGLSIFTIQGTHRSSTCIEVSINSERGLLTARLRLSTQRPALSIHRIGPTGRLAGRSIDAMDTPSIRGGGVSTCRRLVASLAAKQGCRTAGPARRTRAFFALSRSLPTTPRQKHTLPPALALGPFESNRSGLDAARRVDVKARSVTRALGGPIQPVVAYGRRWACVFGSFLGENATSQAPSVAAAAASSGCVCRLCVGC